MYSNGPRIVHRPLTRGICPGRPVRFFGRLPLICISLPPRVCYDCFRPHNPMHREFFIGGSTNITLNTVIASNNNGNKQKLNYKMV